MTFIQHCNRVDAGGGGAGGGGEGGGGDPVLLLVAGDYFSDTGLSVSTGVTLRTTGLFFINSDGGDADYDWLTGGAAEDYAVLATTTSGTLSSGTAGSWLTISSNRTFSVTRSTPGTKVWTGTIQVRRVSDSVVVAGPVSISLTATVNGGDE